MSELAPMELVNRVEAWLSNHPSKVDLQPIHSFGPGMYLRTVHVPKGVMLTSALHTTAHFFVVSKGSFTVWTGDEQPLIVEGPTCGVTLPGTRRFAIANEDSNWTTIHFTEERDIEKIEAEVTAPYDNPYLLKLQEEKL